MRLVVNSRQMKACDRAATERYGMPSLVLMERAALCAVEEMERSIERLSGRGRSRLPKVLIVCGSGNNGGDGLAIGRLLWQKHYPVCVVMLPGKGTLTPETRTQLRILEAYGLFAEHKIPDREFDVVVDALFGIGLSRKVEGVYQDFVEDMNRRKGFKLAVDIPSGIHGDTGEVMGTAFCADCTVTFAFPKLGLLLYPGAEYAGRVVCREIGISGRGVLEGEFLAYMPEPEDLGQMPERKNHSNKGTYGKMLAVAGHRNMAGAAFLCGKACYRTGAGLVKLFTEESNREILQQLLPEAVLTSYEPELTPQLLSELLFAQMKQADVIVAGPGLGTTKAAHTLVEAITKQADCPVILDADALNILSAHPEWLVMAGSRIPVITTPHLGEMARLVKKDIFDIQKQLLQVARDFAREYNVICVLKDARTVTALPDGTAWINTSGTNGMATAGAGDVLTGILAGLIAQKMAPEQAAPLGVYLHGMAAQQMLDQTGAYGMMAQDIIAGIPLAAGRAASAKTE